jgi:hypothetical protein
LVGSPYFGLAPEFWRLPPWVGFIEIKFHKELYFLFLTECHYEE